MGIQKNQMKYTLVISLIAAKEGSPCAGCSTAICTEGEEDDCVASGRRNMQVQYLPQKKGAKTYGCHTKVTGCNSSGQYIVASSRRAALETAEFVSMDDYELKVGNLEECADCGNCFG